VLTPAEQSKLKAQAEADGQIAVGGATSSNGESGH
jgi:cell division protease FtsH